MIFLSVPKVNFRIDLLFARSTREKRSGTSRFFAMYDGSEAAGMKPAGAGTRAVAVVTTVEEAVEVVMIVVENDSVFVIVSFA
jgi:hypothetical protein